MASRPLSNPAFKYRGFEIRYLYVNPNYTQGSEEDKYLYNKPSLSRTGRTGDDKHDNTRKEKIAARYESILGKTQNRPITVGQNQYKNPRDFEAEAGLVKWFSYAQKELGWSKKFDMLQKQVKRNELFKPLPVGVAGVFLRYTWIVTNSPYTNTTYFVDVPMLTGIDGHQGFEIGAVK